VEPKNPNVIKICAGDPGFVKEGDTFRGRLGFAASALIWSQVWCVGSGRSRVYSQHDTPGAPVQAPDLVALAA